MKSIFIFHAIVLCILVSCSKPSGNNSFMTGYWKLDSVGINKDTSLSDAIALIAMNAGDVYLRFTRKDTLYVYWLNEIDTVFYRIEASGKRLVTPGEKDSVMIITRLNDSHAMLTTKDSTKMYLIKMDQGRPPLPAGLPLE